MPGHGVMETETVVWLASVAGAVACRSMLSHQRAMHYDTTFLGEAMYTGPKHQRKLFCTEFFGYPSDYGCPCRKSWTSTSESVFSCGPGDGEKLFDPWASGRKGQQCPQDIRTDKLMFMLFFLS